MTIRCEIVSQDRLVYEGDVDIVVIPGIEGEMGILPDHAPLLSILDHGVIKVRKDNQEEVFTVAGGLVEVQPEIVTILADSAESIEEIDTNRAEEAKRRAEELLAEGPAKDDIDKYLAIEAALRRSNLRLDAVKRYRAGRARVQRTEQSGESD